MFVKVDCMTARSTWLRLYDSALWKSFANIRQRYITFVRDLFSPKR